MVTSLSLISFSLQQVCEREFSGPKTSDSAELIHDASSARAKPVKSGCLRLIRIALESHLSLSTHL